MIEYVLLDVFTPHAFSGNPLAVAIGVQGVAPAAMQTITNELNLSETVFLTPTEDATTWRARIFTPRTELPFAGHPTVGAAVALARSGSTPTAGGTVELVLREGVGDVSVSVRLEPDGRGGSARFRVPTQPVRLGTVARSDAATWASLTVDDLHPEVEPAVWSAGVPFTIVPVANVDVLARARGAPGAEHVYAVAPTDGGPVDATRWRARMFAPAMGIPEDPATGAAASAMAGWLASLDGTTPVRAWTIEQGVEMGRPSRIALSVDRAGPTGSELVVHVEGSAVVVGDGRIAVPGR